MLQMVHPDRVVEESGFQRLPLVERAATIAPNRAVILDTLAWVQHLLHHDSEAAASITRALARLSDNAEIRWHAAVIYAELGDRAKAQAELEAATKLQADVASAAEINGLRERLKTAAGGRP